MGLKVFGEAERIAPYWVRLKWLPSQRSVESAWRRPGGCSDKITPAAMEVDLSGDLSRYSSKTSRRGSIGGDSATRRTRMIAEEFPSDLPVPQLRVDRRAAAGSRLYIRLDSTTKPAQARELAAAYPAPDCSGYQQSVSRMSLFRTCTRFVRAPEPSVGSGRRSAGCCRTGVCSAGSGSGAAAARQRSDVSGEICAEFSTARETTPVAKAQSGSPAWRYSLMRNFTMPCLPISCRGKLPYEPGNPAGGLRNHFNMECISE